MSKDLGVELTKWLIQQRPGLLDADPADTGEVSATLAAALGCSLATILVQAGPTAYEQALKRLVAKVHENAVKTADQAKSLAQGPAPTKQ